jgi:hypothetical protein
MKIRVAVAISVLGVLLPMSMLSEAVTQTAALILPFVLNASKNSRSRPNEKLFL